ncbi:cell wall integrity and stress response component 1-like [Penaeus monodon]|uniref:cell wall integrity and stress response component 1-like n=1 Tax=Penaeus monodon TaxID=6687 RepID=UPI0018A7BC9C|nr:cell wall integrity and stress response component 1-like [Penaeus monodon]
MAKLLILDGNMVTKFDYEANAKVARGRSNAEGSERGRETTEAASQARRRGGRRPYSPCLRTSSSSSSSSSSSKPQPIPQLHPSSSSSSSFVSISSSSSLSAPPLPPAFSLRRIGFSF